MKERVYKSIINSAERLFNRFGISKTAVSDIADMAEVSRATIFNNFGSKDGIVEAVLRRKIDDYREFINNWRGSGESAAGQIKIILLERIRILQSLNFLTDRSLKLKSRYVDIFFTEINEVFNRSVAGVLIQSPGTDREHKSISNSISFMLKGIEQGLFEHIEKIDLPGLEKDMDFFLKQLLPGSRENRTL
jgi:AcrR family transcriptional regulator